MVENELFELLEKSGFFLSIKKSNWSCDRKDCIATIEYNNKIHKIWVELKCRRTHYSRLRIEKGKYDYLILNKNSLYICSTPEGIFAFNIDKINPVWEKTWNPKTTDFENKEMIEKITFDIPIKEKNNITEKIIKK